MEEREKIMIKRLSGGLILLCLTSISLGVTSGEVSITDPDVLEQLKELRTFIDVNRDFSKGFKNLKPVLVEYRSSASKFNGIALGNLSFNTDALHMSIGINTIQADGKMLIVTINVVYEWADYIGYKVKSAKLTAYETLATGDGTFTGDVGVGGDLEVTDDVSVGGDLEVTGDFEVANTSKIKIFENIVDKAGNKRFVEEDGHARTITGLTSAYCKWSLSGSHLMMVFAGTLADETTLGVGEEICYFALPEWIMDKIVPVWSRYLETRSVVYTASDWSTQSDTIYFKKEDYGFSFLSAGLTLTADRNFRIQFDLLIDDDYE